jgi:hypothetical protein
MTNHTVAVESPRMRPRSASRLIVSWLCAGDAVTPPTCLAVAAAVAGLAGVASAVRVLSPEQARNAVVRSNSAWRGREVGRVIAVRAGGGENWLLRIYRVVTRAAKCLSRNSLARESISPQEAYVLHLTGRAQDDASH